MGAGGFPGLEGWIEGDLTPWKQQVFGGGSCVRGCGQLTGPEGTQHPAPAGKVEEESHWITAKLQALLGISFLRKYNSFLLC